MSKKHDPHPVQPKRRALLQGAAAVAGVAGLGSLGFPAISLAQNKPIRIGMPTILSGRVAMLGQASSNAAMMEVEKFNAIGGLGGQGYHRTLRVICIRWAQKNLPLTSYLGRHWIDCLECRCRRHRSVHQDSHPFL